MIDVQSREVPAKPQPKMGKATSAIRSFKEELRKVSWTSKTELQFFTKLVLLATFFFGIGIYLVDLVIKGVLQMIANVAHFIFG